MIFILIFFNCWLELLFLYSPCIALVQFFAFYAWTFVWIFSTRHLWMVGLNEGSSILLWTLGSINTYLVVIWAMWTAASFSSWLIKLIETHHFNLIKHIYCNLIKTRIIIYSIMKAKDSLLRFNTNLEKLIRLKVKDRDYSQIISFAYVIIWEFSLMNPAYRKYLYLWRKKMIKTKSIKYYF